MKHFYYYLFAFVILAFGLSLGLYFSSTSQDSSQLNLSFAPSPTPASTSSSPSLRFPAAAGNFYPEDPSSLKNQLASLINSAPISTQSGKPRILVSPHAGIQYSGSVAGSAYKQLQGHSYQTAIILSSNHHHQHPHVAIYPSGQWQTPLGNLSINSDVARSIIDPNLNLKADTQVFDADHTIEMQLIFLQLLFPRLNIVPILIGQTDDQTLTHLAYKIAGVVNDATLVVISTDWSHYPPASIATQADQLSLKAYLSLNPAKFSQTLNQIETSYAPHNLQTAACGQKALTTSLKLANILHIDHFELLDSQNSGQTQSNQDQVVGYAAIIGRSDSLPSTVLDKNSQLEALQIAKQAIIGHLTNTPSPPYTPQNPSLFLPLGAFVTLEKHDQLRGCIGYFEPGRPLFQVIKQAAIDAATNDSRFSPLTLDELEAIQLEISVLSSKKKVTNWQQIRPGIDGVVIEKGDKSGTFLPQVATDNNWDLPTFLANLCTQKVHLPANCYQDPTISLFTFQAQIFSESTISAAD